MGDAPLISVVLPVWNGERYLEQAMRSILNQSYDNFELIVVNDCSTDASLPIAQSFAEKDSRICVISNESNLKLPASLNQGFSVARGMYFTWTSDDNLLERDFLKTLLHELLNSDADLVYSDFNSIDDEGMFLGVSPVGEAEELISQNTIGASFLYKRKVHEAIGGYDVDKFLYEDYDFWIRAYLSGFKFRRLHSIVYNYRRHKDALTSTRKMPEEYPLYRYALRRKFVGVSKKAAFDAREILLGYRRELGLLKTLSVTMEAFWLDPRKALSYFLPKIRKIPAKMGRRLFRRKARL